MKSKMQQEESPALKPHPTKLIVETTTRCNLQCPMCLKNTRTDVLADVDMSYDTFKTLMPALSSAQVLVLNGIGEPLLHPHLDDFIRTAKHHMPSGSWIGFQSNGLLIDEHRAESLIEAGLDRICLSIDAMDPEGFRLIRKGGELSEVTRALQFLNAARIRHHIPLEIGIEFVLRNDNMEELPATVRWAGSIGVDFALVTHLSPYHPDLSPRTVYTTNSDATVALFNEYLKRSEKKGLDIRRYHDVYMKYLKTREERKIIKLVESMKSEAMRHRISLNLRKLFTMDHTMAEKIQSVFEETRSAASSIGLDLRLPSIIPKSTRKCEFIEEGCAFISVNGDVHPCYSLWHHYCLYMNGFENAVGTKRFGSLSDRGILEIWNDPAYTTFRSNVLKYDYPFCFDCSFALCDYVNNEEFEQDCYINPEPCAACLWCRDLLQCLK
jgi:putative metalloenzyme radical SAM/SPASM domain maturase